MNPRDITTWTNRELFEAIEGRTAQESAAQSVLSARDMTGHGITQAESVKWRAELAARHADMDETSGIA